MGKIDTKKPFKAFKPGKGKPFNAKNKKFQSASKFSPKIKPPSDGTEQSKTVYWNNFKKQQKELKDNRRKTKLKDLYDTNVAAKKIYEKLKCKTTKNKEELCKALHNQLNKENTYSKIIMCHDTARIIQCLIKHASMEIKSEIAEKLQTHFVDICKSKYAHFCIQRLLKYGSKNLRDKILNALFKNIAKLTLNNISSPIIDNIYTFYATNDQKALMRQEFYSDLYAIEKNKSVKNLKDVLQDHSFMKNAVMAHLKKNILLAANKKVTENSLLHDILLEFLEEADENERNEIITSYNNLLANIACTKSGSKAATILFSHASPKDRKHCLKSMKEFLVKLCTHEHGHLLILSILSMLDDTVTLNKLILAGIMNNLDEILANERGRKVISWMVVPGDITLFHPKLIESLDEYNQFGKKDKAIRRNEIYSHVIEQIIKSINENAGFWLSNGSIGLLTVAVIKTIHGDNLKSIYSSLSGVVCNAEWTVQNEAANELGIENVGLHMILKKLAKQDKEKNEGDPTFGEIIMSTINGDTIQKWFTLNRACFFVLNLYESGIETTKAKISSYVETYKELLQKQDHKGGKLLLEKVQ